MAGGAVARADNPRLPPSENDSKIAAVREIEKLKDRQMDVTVYINTGEKANKMTWRDALSPSGKWMGVEYKSAGGTITPNWNWGELPDLAAIELEKPAPVVDPAPIPDATPAPKSIIVNEPEPAKPMARTWTSADGKFKTEAVFLSATGGNVKLLKSNGTEITVPRANLSSVDQEWLKDFRAGR